MVTSRTANPGVTFTTRVVDIPDSPDNSPSSSPFASGATFPYRQDKSSSSAQRPSTQPSPPPAIPSSLFDALNRDPPPLSNGLATGSPSLSYSTSSSSSPNPSYHHPSAARPSRAPPQSHTHDPAPSRTSLSYSRDSQDNNTPIYPSHTPTHRTSSSTANTSPHSSSPPLQVFDSAEGFSYSATTSSPSTSATIPSRDASNSSRTGSSVWRFGRSGKTSSSSSSYGSHASPRIPASSSTPTSTATSPVLSPSQPEKRMEDLPPPLKGPRPTSREQTPPQTSRKVPSTSAAISSGVVDGGLGALGGASPRARETEEQATGNGEEEDEDEDEEPKVELVGGRVRDELFTRDLRAGRESDDEDDEDSSPTPESPQVERRESMIEASGETEVSSGSADKGGSLSSRSFVRPLPEATGSWPENHQGAISKGDYVVAVIGPRGVGKSTVIQTGLKTYPVDAPSLLLSDAQGNRATSCVCSFAQQGVRKTIQLLEIDSLLLEINEQGLVWPRVFPPCDGLMLCYDATDAHALPPLTALLQALWTRGSTVPSIVLGCKSHLNPAVSPHRVGDICNIYGAGTVKLDGGMKDPKMKEAFKWIMRSMQRQRGEVPRRPSSASTADLSPTSRRTSTATERRTSTSTNDGRRPSTAPGESPRRGSIGSNAPNDPNSLLPAFDSAFTSGSIGLMGLEVVEEAPVGPGGPAATESEGGKDALHSGVVAGIAEQPDPEGEKSSPMSSHDPNPDAGLSSTPVMGSLDLHFSREDMIDKFLFASVTGNDETYVTLFLIVYRRFARPYDVVSKLIERFEFVAGRLKTDPLLSRFAQMKLCGVLATWFNSYPGDFSAPATLGILQPFLQGLLPRGATWVAHYAVELIPRLGDVAVMSDPEASWALPDRTLNDDALSISSRRPSLAPSNDGSLLRGRSESDAGTATSMTDSNTTKTSRKLRMANDAHLVDLSNALLELPEDVVAQQITRIAWESFSKMTPRDLMRHVLAPRDTKKSDLPSDTSSSVMKSIAFVNYLGDWVATMILVQSKLKWRARVMEKFISIASSLRRLENFDSLMGILVGLNSQPVFRLTETMEAISLKLEGDRSKLPKRLRSLNKLMSQTKSFAAYRLALSTSGAEMLPYLGVHLQEITLTNEVKADMRDGKVNWTKFSAMGRSAAIVLECSRQPPVYPVDRGVERCVLNIPVLSADRQYELSYEYQPRGETTTNRTKLRKLVRGVGESFNT